MAIINCPSNIEINTFKKWSAKNIFKVNYKTLNYLHKHVHSN